MSEMVLCRAIQILTLGAHVWNDPSEQSPFMPEASNYVPLKEGVYILPFPLGTQAVIQRLYRDHLQIHILV